MFIGKRGKQGYSLLAPQSFLVSLVFFGCSDQLFFYKFQQQSFAKHIVRLDEQYTRQTKLVNSSWRKGRIYFFGVGGDQKRDKRSETIGLHHHVINSSSGQQQYDLPTPTRSPLCEESWVVWYISCF